MTYVRFPLSLRNVEDLPHERGIEVSHEAVRYWWNRFGPLFAGEIRRRPAHCLRAFPQWRWHLDGKRPVWPPYVVVFHGMRSSTQLIL